MTKRFGISVLALFAAFALVAAPVASAQGNSGSARTESSKKDEEKKSKAQAKRDEASSKKSTGEATSTEKKSSGQATSTEKKSAGQSKGQATSTEKKSAGQSKGQAKAADAKSGKGAKGAKGAKAGGKNKGPYTSGTPGNNGTVKIDGREFDDHRRNEPHPGCDFRVQFFGFDEGPDLYATVTFDGHAPTGGGTLLTDRVYIGGGYTVTRVYNLSSALAGVEPHPKQGYHVKLTVNAEYSQGADVKHKVFWVQCDQPVPVVGGGEIEQPDEIKDETVCPEGSTMVDGVCAKSEEVEADESNEVEAEETNEVLGTQLRQDEAVPAEDEVAAAQQRRGLGAALPFTGASLVAFLLAGLALIGGGFAFLKARRS